MSTLLHCTGILPHSDTHTYIYKREVGREGEQRVHHGRISDQQRKAVTEYRPSDPTMAMVKGLDKQTWLPHGERSCSLGTHAQVETVEHKNNLICFYL